MPSISTLQTVNVSDPRVHKPDCTKESPVDKLSSPLADVTDARALVEDDRQLAKDQRSYERNRHRLKTAITRAKQRARKDRGFSRPESLSLFVSEKEKRLRDDDVDPLRDVKVTGVEFSTNTDKGPCSIRPAAGVYKGEVKLWDLITAGKSRKAKGTYTPPRYLLYPVQSLNNFRT